MPAAVPERRLGLCRSAKRRSLEDPGTEADPEKESTMRTPFISSRVATHQRHDVHAAAEHARINAQTLVPRRVSAQKETPMAIEMPTIHHSRTAIAAFVAVLTFALSTPFAVNAEDQVLVEEPVLTAEDQVPALAPVAGPSWDETSGYGAVEASRATIGHPAASTTQVPSDVRWAPARVIVPGASLEAMRVLAAQQALQSRDLGSMQEDALFAVVAAGASWDETSGYGSVEASRAANALPDVPAASVSPDFIPAALASGQRAESAHLATVPVPGDVAVAVHRIQR
jgi:hypothetical protein